MLDYTTKQVTPEQVVSLNEEVLSYFRRISEIPRSSGHEEKIADYLEGFTKELDIPYVRTSDIIFGKQTHNVIMYKKGSIGREDEEPIIFQAHLDMVCQRDPGTTHDFETDPIDVVIDGNLMKAIGTTLGADNGIGVAYMLAFLSDESLSHPPIEAVFTSDEEDGMTGVMAIKEDLLKGKRLINIDSEDEGIFFFGCAGGVVGEVRLPISYEPIPDTFSVINVEIKGLLGGHSGIEIHLGRANAHKLLGRLLTSIENVSNIHLVSIKGGNKNNVITKEVSTMIAIPTEDINIIKELIKKSEAEFNHEFESIEEGIRISVSDYHEASEALSKDDTLKFVRLLLLLPDGVHSKHPTVDNLVGTSSNLGTVFLDEEHAHFGVLIRSFMDSKKHFLLDEVKALASLVEASINVKSDFPEWDPNPKSKLKLLFDETYQTVFHQKPVFQSVHAGLETGYLSKRYPDMDMISMGPTITGAHTSEEALQLDTLLKTTELLIHVLLVL